MAENQPGPIYDDAMKILAADDLDALLSVVGVRAYGAREVNVELAGSRRVDLLADVGGGLVHVEYVKDHPHDLDVRMVEYWARIRRRHPESALASSSWWWATTSGCRIGACTTGG